MKRVLIILVLSLPVQSFAASSGKVLEISFASTTAQTVRPGTAQFSIEGGFSPFGDCDQTYAAIAIEDTHLISLLLAAKAQGIEVEVHLDQNNKYYGNRCQVSYLEWH